MEKTNNRKAELIAIYRLEFYKKQNSWKFNKDAKSKKYKPENKKHILNKTYSIEEPTTQSGFLNDAFIETVSDNDKDNTQSPSVAKNMETEITTERLSNEYHNSANPCSQNDQFGTSHPLIHIENALTQECLTSEQDLLDFHSYPRELQTGYLLDSNENSIHTSALDRLLSKDPQVTPGLDCGGHASNILSRAENWLREECLWFADDEDLHWIDENAEASALGEWSSDSWLDFVRGADMVPHSSQVELTLPNALNEVGASGDALARLSAVQLRQAVHAHSLLLRRLLTEETHRRRIRSCLSLTASSVERPQSSPRPATDMCTYEQPTRDCGPYHDHSTIDNALQRGTFKMPEDTFLAGSYRSHDLEVSGRGRGRLQSAMHDAGDRVVGIGRGRPFRIT